MFQFGDDAVCTDVAPFVMEIKDNMDNGLNITVALPRLGEKGSDVDETADEKIQGIMKESSPIYPDFNKAYEIYFDTYITYQVRNESFCSWDDYEVRHGKYFIVFERSRYLEQLQNITNCCQFEDGSYYPGEWKHFGIYAQNHVIDVISHGNPEIKRINGR